MESLSKQISSTPRRFNTYKNRFVNSFPVSTYKKEGGGTAVVIMTGEESNNGAGRLPHDVIETVGIQAGTTEIMHPCQKAPEVRQTLAQPARAWKTISKNTSAVGGTPYLIPHVCGFLNRETSLGDSPRTTSSDRGSREFNHACNYAPIFSFFRISAAIFSISAWINPFVAKIVLPPNTYGFPSRSLIF